MMKFLPITVFLYVTFQTKIWNDLYEIYFLVPTSNDHRVIMFGLLSATLFFGGLMVVAGILTLYTNLLLPLRYDSIHVQIVRIVFAVSIVSHWVFSIVTIFLYADRNSSLDITISVGFCFFLFCIVSYMEWIWIIAKKLNRSREQYDSDASTETYDTI